MSECQADGSSARDYEELVGEWVKGKLGRAPTAVDPKDCSNEETGKAGPTDRPRPSCRFLGEIARYEIFCVGNPWKNWVFLRLLTNDGYEGIGEVSLNGFTRTSVACIQELSRHFLGKHPADYRGITEHMLRDQYSDAGQLHRGVIAAVEMACLDILGKRAGMPVWALLGSKVQGSVPVYGNGWYRVKRSPEAFALASSMALRAGYDMLKVDPFGGDTSPLSPQQRGCVYDIVRALSLSSPTTRYAMEAHQRLDIPDAQWVVRELLNQQWLWLEEPLPWWDFDGLGRLAQASHIPIATGENLTSVRQFEDLARRSGNLILQPDIMNLGGITQALEVCRLAEHQGFRVCPHDAQGPVSRATCAHLAALSPAVWMLEDFDPWNPPWTLEIAKTFRALGGQIVLPGLEQPGLGVALDWGKISEHPYEVDGWLPPFEPGWEHRREIQQTGSGRD